MTAYDWLLGRRTAALGIAMAALLFLAMLGTDDAAGTHAGRLGRLAALSSLAGGAAASVAMAQARSRGEVRALGAMGLPDIRASLGAVLGGTLVGMLGAPLALLPGVDLTPLFPHALPAGGGWVRANGAWVDSARGVRVDVDGALSWVGVAPSGISTMLSTPALATLIALGVAAVALPLWATARGAAVRRAVVSFAIASAAVFVFHLVAADRISAAALVIPPLLLLVDGVALHLGGAWS